MTSFKDVWVNVMKWWLSGTTVMYYRISFYSGLRRGIWWCNDKGSLLFCPTGKLSQELQQECEQVNTPSDLREVLSPFLDYITLVPKGEDGLRQSIQVKVKQLPLAGVRIAEDSLFLYWLLLKGKYWKPCGDFKVCTAFPTLWSTSGCHRPLCTIRWGNKFHPC